MNLMKRVLGRMMVVAVLLGGLASCGSKKSEQGAIDHSAKSIESHECAACGMIVREQSAPRGQLIHRDGTRLYFCSLSDMVTYLDAPSQHGDAVDVFVESMDEAVEPLSFNTKIRPWLDAKKTSYVVDIDKKRVMGRPVLSYSTPDKAKDKAKELSGSLKSWTELLSRK